MRTRTTLALALLVASLLGSNALAGTLHPALEEQLQQASRIETIKVLVSMEERVDVAALDLELHAARTTMGSRHEIVLNALQETARASQSDLLRALDAMQADGRIDGYTPHWIVNGVVVRGTPDAIRELAARADVHLVEPDLQVELIEPATPPTVAAQGARRGFNGLSPSITAMGIDRVWNELGLDGTGVIVGVMDTGVDGVHPSLAPNWHGNFVPSDQAWRDVSGTGHPNFPVENQYHGTHVTSIICGQPVDGDVFGVAPGAHWIATNMLWSYAGDALDNAVLASLEFMADPDGDPSTTHDMPAVVNNSWGVNETYLDYNDCDTRWYDAIDALEAVGVVLLWAAGNEGADDGPMSIRSPADRASSPSNAFSVGSTGEAAPFLVSDFSSLGPSGCGGPHEIKPELTAIGEDVFGAYPDSNFAWIGGTSQATPHVAGVVALMRQANPDLDVITIKHILMDTAIDLGVPGEDNTYGHGILDAYAAVTAAMGAFGIVEGMVTDAGTGLPLPDAQIAVTGFPQTAVTDSVGHFRVSLPEGAHTIEFSLYGYLHDSLGVSVVDAGNTDGSFGMTLAPHSTVSGYVYDPSGTPVASALVRALGVPTPAASTDGTGYYEIVLPTGTSYTLNASTPGLAPDQYTLLVGSDLTQDFQLPDLLHEDFERGHFVTYDWYFPVARPWVLTDTVVSGGSFAATAGEMPDATNAVMAVTLDVLAESEISFSLKTSTHEDRDQLWFYVDGDAWGRWSGETDWTEVSFTLPAGTHEIGWIYLKDNYSSAGADRVWVDDITWPTIAEPVYPVASTLTPSIDQYVISGIDESRSITVENTGPGDLDFHIEVTLNDIIAPVGGNRQGVGGPDEYGYYWFDETNPAGPVYDWVEISGIGQDTGLGNSGTAGPFDLGFTFNQYGQDFDQVSICTHGWLAMGSVFNNYGHGSPFPDPQQPNGMIAAFWDVLVPGPSGSVLYHSDPLNDRFIAQWDSVTHNPSYNVYEDPEYFQIILDADGSILFQYKQVRDAGDCTVGMENADGTLGMTIAHNEPFLQDGRAVKVMKVDPWTSSPAGTTTVTSGNTASADVDFHPPANLVSGLYSATVTIVTNDPDNHRIDVPVTMDLAVSTAAPGSNLPSRFALGAVSPNPFNPSTQISYDVPAGGGRVTLTVYDLAGRKVRTLVAEDVRAGRHTAQWNGRDEAGRRVASGVYLCRMTAPGVEESRKMTLLK